MGVIIRYSVLCFLFDFLVTYAGSIPVAENPQSLHVLPYIAKRSDGSSVCEEAEMFKWTYGFHECFIDRKYNDGGRKLNSIVDRILEHGEVCMEVSSLECRPDFRGFTTVLNKTIFQMKDYAEMYLEEIYKGKENIKDLDCVETILNIKTYQDCFRSIVPLGHNESEETFQKAVKKGVSCANGENSGCSKEAKTVFNRIVRIILGVEQPDEEVFEEEIKPTEQPVEEESEEDIKWTEQPVEEKFEEGIKPAEAPAPMRWYDYLAYPFVMVYRAIANLFSG
ncbi:unnamed protein product [Larinioides sclopetarius]|uniref:Uncharacterized protein n=1 Tax=Larinioides sclopetarius TaxID=280406 RepID=A0AAV1YYQ6_9ARAC